MILSVGGQKRNRYSKMLKQYSNWGWKENELIGFARVVSDGVFERT